MIYIIMKSDLKQHLKIYRFLLSLRLRLPTAQPMLIHMAMEDALEDLAKVGLVEEDSVMVGLEVLVAVNMVTITGRDPLMKKKTTRRSSQVEKNLLTSLTLKMTPKLKSRRSI